ncbi:MAG: LrgB family protein [Spirochaetales bacterium]
MEGLIHLTATLMVYALAQAGQSWMKRGGEGKRDGSGTLPMDTWGAWCRRMAFVFHPVLVSVLVIMAALVLTHTPYETYADGTKGLTFLLAPSVVALGVPLYKEWKKLKEEIGRILVTVTFGSFVGIVSSILPAILWGTPPEVISSLAPRSVTTPIAMSIAEGTGGVPALSAVVVVMTGIWGAVVGPVLLSLLGRVESSAFGLAMGVASHGIGTARTLEIGEREGAYAALGLCLNGILTSLIVPWFTPFVIDNSSFPIV